MGENIKDLKLSVEGCNMNILKKNLRSLNVNQKATIISVSGKGQLPQRMRDMGLVPGAEIKVIGRAPLKDPVALKIGGAVLTLRNNEADYIYVKELSEH